MQTKRGYIPREYVLNIENVVVQFMCGGGLELSACHKIDWWWRAMRAIGAIVSIGISTKIRCWLYLDGEVWSGLHVQLVS